MDASNYLIFVLGALLVLQAAWIAVLIIKDRRHAASEREHYAEVTHTARLSVIGEMTAAIVHEVTQPLSAILSNVETAELLLQAPDPKLASVLDILEDVRHDDLRAYDIVKALRALLKKRELSFEPVDLNSLISKVVALVLPDAVRRGVVIDTALTAGIPMLVADPIHLQQVLLNLIVNAMEAMDETPAADRWVEIRTRMQAGHAQVEVIDNGHGISVQPHDKLFDPFFTTKAEGVGLGLALSKSIIALHGGSIRVENRERGGAAFIFTLPTKTSHAMQGTRRNDHAVTLH